MLKEIRLPIGIGVAGIVAKSGESLIVNDAPNDRRVFRKTDEAISFKTRNILAVPIKVQDRTIGVLEAINSVRKPEYDQNDLNLLQSMSEQAGIAIHNRALIDSLQEANVSLERRIRELTAINKISQSISRNFDYNITEILSKTVLIVSETLDVNRVSIFLHDERSRTLRMVHATGIPSDHQTDVESPVSSKIMGHVFRTGQSLLIEDLNLHPEFGRFKRLRYASRSFVCVALKVKNRIIGVMNIADKRDGQPFQKSDLQIIETIANQVSESHENSLFYKEVLEKQRMEKELEVANAIQQHILSKEFLNFEGIDVVATSIPATEIGGDFYDCLRISDERYGIYIADVSGKGVPAALFMALSHSIMKIVSLNECAPSATLAQANRFILSDSKNGMFVTLFYCYIDIRQKTLHYGCAGHNEQIYYDSRNDRFELIKIKGIPLGVMEGAAYPQGTISITKGDFIVLFTDGVIEALNRDNEQYGLPRLQTVISRCTKRGATGILTAIQDDVKLFCGDAKQFDDLTLFVIKF
jgi:sigma-B regulation protein RsbU (phosphoserine phosphatase)